MLEEFVLEIVSLKISFQNITINYFFKTVKWGLEVSAVVFVLKYD